MGLVAVTALIAISNARLHVHHEYGLEEIACRSVRFRPASDAHRRSTKDCLPAARRGALRARPLHLLAGTAAESEQGRRQIRLRSKDLRAGGVRQLPHAATVHQ